MGTLLLLTTTTLSVVSPHDTLSQTPSTLSNSFPGGSTGGRGSGGRASLPSTPPPRLYSFFEETAGGRGAAVLPPSLRPRHSSGAPMPRALPEGGEQRGGGGIRGPGVVAAAPFQLTGVTFLQWNCNGVQSSRTELSENLESKGINVACLQESKLSSASPFTDFPNYSSLRRDRSDGRGGWGLLTLIHHDVIYTTLNTDHLFPSDSTIEHQGFTITVDGAKLNKNNIYLPPNFLLPHRLPAKLATTSCLSR